MDAQKQASEVLSMQAAELPRKDPEQYALDNTVIEEADVATAIAVDPRVETSICRKFDLRLLPVLSIMYLFNSLDKSNLGNAKTDGLEADLGLVGNQYNILLSVFYVPYVLCAFPIALLGKRFGVALVLPLLMVGFGGMSLISAGCHNWGGLMTTRWFLGTFESAFFPLVIYYLTTFYRRGELARRLAIFYAASNIANAFSGLLSFGIFHIKNDAIEGWRWLFIIEGATTMLAAVGAFFLLPRDIASCRYLTAEEKEVAFLRMQSDSSAVVNEKLNIRDAVKVFRQPAVIGWLILEVCLGVPLQSISLFLPQIVSRLGFSTVKTNLYTVAPNVSGAVVLLVLAFFSDRLRLRFPFIAAGFLFPVIGFVIYASIDVLESTGVAYFACFLMTAGTSAPSVLLSTWFSNNTPSEGRRAALTAVGVPTANLMGLISSNIFRAQDAPDYIPALVTTAAFGFVGFVTTMALGFWMKYDNARRNREQNVILRVGDVSTHILSEGPKHESYRWFL
ncbi:major facilitator superfamily domain-containing protein [Dipodascopsis tothii]|uniref:major facilitator superfamily domain-containing protein n=1 Tax=Dipodascopsis tothii TaxID=44089 RepID=UPI0034CFB4FC